MGTKHAVPGYAKLEDFLATMALYLRQDSEDIKMSSFSNMYILESHRPGHYGFAGRPRVEK